MKDASLLAELGISVEEGGALFERCKTGQMSFADFVTMTRFLDSVGGSGGMVQGIAELPDDSGTSGMAEKIAGYQEILAAMEGPELANATLLIAEDVPARQRVRRLAVASGRTEAAVDQFLLEYKTMVTMLMNLGSGRSMDETTRSLAVMRADQEMEAKSRRTRRKIKGGKVKKEPEWMKL